MKIITKIKSEHGSSSVLVVMMMTVLLVFGLAIFSTALTNRKLVDKKTQWIVEYYQVENVAMQAVSAVYQRLQDGNHADFTSLSSDLTDALAPFTDNLSLTDYPAQPEHKLLSITIGHPDKGIDKNIDIKMIISGTTAPFHAQIVAFEQWQAPFEIEDVFDFE